MSSRSAAAVVAFTGPNAPLAGVDVKLKQADQDVPVVVGTTNGAGYCSFWLTLPFTGILQLSGAAAYYEQTVEITEVNTTLHVGPTGPLQPQDQQLPACSPFKKPLPSVPSREEVCNGQMTAQAINVHSLKYGTMPWWPACWAWLSQEDRAHIAPQLLAIGDEVMLIDVPSDVPLYDEADQFYAPTPQPGYPLADFGPLVFDPVALKVLVAETLGYGFKGCHIFLDGDVSYDTAVGQVQAIAPVMAELNEYVAYVPGWDGVWQRGPDSYSREQLASFAVAARAAGAIYLGCEHSTGYPLAGKGTADFVAPNGVMSGYDFILGEFNSGVFDGTVWELLARYTNDYKWPGYGQPTTGPESDPPLWPFYPVTGERGPVYYRIFEWAMYVGVRGESIQVMAGWKAIFRSMTASTRIC